ncbi:hypothetical protein, partial [Aliiruegeria sabulilitoris]|uniref:hypothetical protein n=1 Tax=Aliiruegeria sabulilitoris TaxID=1510458 RepID=UPI001E40BF0C
VIGRKERRSSGVAVAANGGKVGKLAVRSWSAATGPPAPARTAVNCAILPLAGHGTSHTQHGFRPS